MKKLFWTIAFLAIILGGVYLFNYLTLTQPVLSETASDYRNEGIKFELHYKNYVLINTLVFNLKNVQNDKAVADVFRVFLQTTLALKEKEFETIELSFRGAPKFTLKGDYFAELGKEYGDQNPIYTMRTFPEHLYDMSGQSAYSEWSGGLLSVLNKQMEDFKDFHDKWYLEDMGYQTK